MNMHFQTFRLQPPYVPPSGDALLLRTRLGHRLALHCYRQNFGLRSLVAVSSVTKGRIEFVSRPTFGSQFYGLSVHFQLLSTSCRHDAVTFSYWREAPPERDFHSPVHAHSQAHDRDRPGRPSRRLADWSTAAHNYEPNRFRFQRGSLRRDATRSPTNGIVPTQPIRAGGNFLAVFSLSAFQFFWRAVISRAISFAREKPPGWLRTKSRGPCRHDGSVRARPCGPSFRFYGPA